MCIEHNFTKINTFKFAFWLDLIRNQELNKINIVSRMQPDNRCYNILNVITSNTKW